MPFDLLAVTILFASTSGETPASIKSFALCAVKDAFSPFVLKKSLCPHPFLNVSRSLSIIVADVPSRVAMIDKTAGFSF